MFFYFIIFLNREIIEKKNSLFKLSQHMWSVRVGLMKIFMKSKLMLDIITIIIITS